MSFLGDWLLVLEGWGTCYLIISNILTMVQILGLLRASAPRAVRCLTLLVSSDNLLFFLLTSVWSAWSGAAKNQTQTCSWNSCSSCFSISRMLQWNRAFKQKGAHAEWSTVGQGTGGGVVTAQRFKASEVTSCEVVNAVSHQSLFWSVRYILVGGEWAEVEIQASSEQWNTQLL